MSSAVEFPTNYMFHPLPVDWSTPARLHPSKLHCRPASSSLTESYALLSCSLAYPPTHTHTPIHHPSPHAMPARSTRSSGSLNAFIGLHSPLATHSLRTRYARRLAAADAFYQFLGSMSSHHENVAKAHVQAVQAATSHHGERAGKTEANLAELRSRAGAAEREASELRKSLAEEVQRAEQMALQLEIVQEKVSSLLRDNVRHVAEDAASKAEIAALQRKLVTQRRQSRRKGVAGPGSSSGSPRRGSLVEHTLTDTTLETMSGSGAQQVVSPNSSPGAQQFSGSIPSALFVNKEPTNRHGSGRGGEGGSSDTHVGKCGEGGGDKHNDSDSAPPAGKPVRKSTPQSITGVPRTPPFFSPVRKRQGASRSPSRKRAASSQRRSGLETPNVPVPVSVAASTATTTAPVAAKEVGSRQQSDVAVEAGRAAAAHGGDVGETEDADEGGQPRGWSDDEVEEAEAGKNGGGGGGADGGGVGGRSIRKEQGWVAMRHAVSGASGEFTDAELAGVGDARAGAGEGDDDEGGGGRAFWRMREKARRDEQVIVLRKNLADCRGQLFQLRKIMRTNEEVYARKDAVPTCGEECRGLKGEVRRLYKIMHVQADDLIERDAQLKQAIRSGGGASGINASSNDAVAFRANSMGWSVGAWIAAGRPSCAPASRKLDSRGQRRGRGGGAGGVGDGCGGGVGTRMRLGEVLLIESDAGGGGVARVASRPAFATATRPGVARRRVEGGGQGRSATPRGTGRRMVAEKAVRPATAASAVGRG